MIRLIMSSFVFFMIYCAGMQNEVPKTINTISFSDKWDSSTIEALNSIQDFSADVKGKSVIIKESFSKNSSDIDYLDRQNFLDTFQNYLDTFSLKIEMIIIELRESGESITNTKALMGLPENKLVVFDRESTGNWVVRSSSFLAVDQVDFLKSTNPLPNTNGDDIWGLNINDCLILTFVDANGIKVKPVLFAKKKSIDLIRRILFRTKDGRKNVEK